MSTKPKPQFLAYARISKDPDGQSTAPERQLEDMHKFADLKGFEIVEEFIDRDTSAFDKRAKRPGYKEMLEAMESERYDGVVVWKLDRLIRRIVEFSAFWKIATETQTQLVSVNDPIDTREPIGVAFVYLLVGLAEQEAHNMGMRLRRKEMEDAEAGIRHAGGKTAFGMARDGTIIEDQAAVIREAASRLLAGESASSVTRDFNERKVTTANGKMWTRRGLTNLMGQARLFGWREHHGELKGKGDWPAILDEATGRALRDLLPAKSLERTRQPRVRTTLLSGILRCASCGRAMRAGSRHDGHGVYRCPPLSEGGCGGTSVRRKAVEDVTVEMILYRLESPALVAAIQERRNSAKSRDDTDLLAALAAHEHKAREASDMWAAGELDRAGYARAMRSLEEQETKLNEQLRNSVETGPLDALMSAADGLRGTWGNLPLGRQRAVLEVMIEQIKVHPTDSDYYLDRLSVSLTNEIAELRPELERLTRLRAIARSIPDVEIDAAEQAAVIADERTPSQLRRYLEKPKKLTPAARAKMSELGAEISYEVQGVRDKINRRETVIEERRGMGPQFRPERLEPIWRI